MRLDPIAIENLISQFLAEDLGRGDVTTDAILTQDVKARGRFLAKQDLTLAGLEVAEMVFQWFDPEIQIQTFYLDGDTVPAGKEIARIVGPAHMLLAGERVALNLLQRMSGIATLTRAFVQAIEGTEAVIADTRKTAPGLRLLDKYAVHVGGGHNHRFGLDDGILIKDNHIALAGGIEPALRRAKKNASHLLKIEVEVSTLDQAREAVSEGADVILLDNMTVDQVRECVALVRELEPPGRQTLIEVSGNMALDTVRAYAEAGANLISVGALTHSVKAADISLKLSP
ncbi:MAG: carboxylating nicotinate-nucleotide diphosphorylase [Chloracidobacterium sp.]|uniref:nicotinate-nucleotide diphosphorylase (carboxylating) n=1 Tax=Chloracidobacterium validum TaxID=2821543 RepID=A0ABX8BBC0_9BACT|nr:carboxylating nicotinate-nucleotide diphosphorylase [Chloracidobacterium validum]QUW02954.1 carboxylating nicotinate-nucleotide diphosphorylase [Chloracidobacterium validum]